MNNESEPTKVFYDTQTGQLIVTRGEIGISVYKITEEPIARALHLMKQAENNTGNISICALVELPAETPAEPSDSSREQTNPENNNTVIRGGSL